MSEKIYCHHCDLEIVWKEKPTGGFMPIDPYTQTRHYCKQYDEWHKKQEIEAERLEADRQRLIQKHREETGYL
jgi:hypothetical protein